MRRGILSRPNCPNICRSAFSLCSNCEGHVLKGKMYSIVEPSLALPIVHNAIIRSVYFALLIIHNIQASATITRKLIIRNALLTISV